MLDSQARILIVEDQAIIAEDLAETLTDLGCLVVGVARHCGEAEQILANFRADLVLLDVDFHGEKAGLLAALRIQQEFHTPIVYVTACTSSDLGPALAMTQPRGLVPKPIDVNYLAAVLRRALRGPGSLSPT